MMSTPTIRNTSKITLYTNHVCPFAHRVHITLAELGLSYDEVIIPLDRPREEWFLRDVNPVSPFPLSLPPPEQENEMGTEIYIYINSAV